MTVPLIHRRSNCAKASLYKKMTPQLLNVELAGSPKRKAYSYIDQESELKKTYALASSASTTFFSFFSFFYSFSFFIIHEYIVHGYINNSSVLVLSLGLILGPGPQNRQGPWCWW